MNKVTTRESMSALIVRSFTEEMTITITTDKNEVVTGIADPIGVTDFEFGGIDSNGKLWFRPDITLDEIIEVSISEIGV